MLKLKPATQLIGGKQTQMYGAFLGNSQIDNVPALNYSEAQKYIDAANLLLVGTGRRYNTQFAGIIYHQVKDIFLPGNRNRLAREALGLSNESRR